MSRMHEVSQGVRMVPKFIRLAQIVTMEKCRLIIIYCTGTDGVVSILKCFHTYAGKYFKLIASINMNKKKRIGIAI